MAVLSASEAPTYTQRIDRFGGVDFTTNETQVPTRRSPDALNMIADEKFFPVKRAGYEKLYEYGGRIYGLFVLSDAYGEALIVHAGNSLYIHGMDEAVCSDGRKQLFGVFVRQRSLHS